MYKLKPHYTYKWSYTYTRYIHILYTGSIHISNKPQKSHGTWAGSSEVTAQTSPSLPKVILPNMGGFHGDR